MAIELATAYVSLVPETSKLEKAVTDTFKGVGKQAEMAGREAGSRLAQTATKALKDGWRPDQDIMAGIPNTRLDRIGSRMGQVIGKGEKPKPVKRPKEAPKKGPKSVDDLQARKQRVRRGGG